MTQQRPDSTANERYIKRLFVESGLGFIEVKARIVEPYNPPSPAPNIKEVRVLNAPSHIIVNSFSSYSASLTLLFMTKADFTEYLTFASWTHKFYDEKGHIFLGSVDGLKATAKEASTKYLVDLSLLLIKKDGEDKKNRFQFQDLDGITERVDIEEMAQLGLVSIITRAGQPVLYFRPNAFITRAEYVAFLNRTRRFIERIVRE